MKIQLMVATEDVDYAQHLSQVLAERYADTFEVSVCTTRERLGEMLAKRACDVLLASPEMVRGSEPGGVGITLVLWDELETRQTPPEGVDIARKYQRISALTGEILEKYAAVAGKKRVLDADRARVSAFWSPAGGTGTTTAALACAARLVARGRRTVYLDLEHFSSVPVYFANDGKSISEAFEKLEGNLELLLQSIRRQDPGSGIFYFCAPSNYDDMNILTAGDIRELIGAAGSGVDEVVLDLPSVCDERCREIFALTDALFVVTDPSRRGQRKLAQFQEQNDVYARVRDKLTLVCNMGAAPPPGVREPTVSLPYVRSDSPSSVYKSLSAVKFEP